MGLGLATEVELLVLLTVEGVGRALLRGEDDLSAVATPYFVGPSPIWLLQIHKGTDTLHETFLEIKYLIDTTGDGSNES